MSLTLTKDPDPESPANFYLIKDGDLEVGSYDRDTDEAVVSNFLVDYYTNPEKDVRNAIAKKFGDATHTTITFE
jgi:hypothetical protein